MRKKHAEALNIDWYFIPLDLLLKQNLELIKFHRKRGFLGHKIKNNSNNHMCLRIWTNVYFHRPSPQVNPSRFICNLISHVPSDNIVVINHFNGLMRIKLTIHICKTLYSLQHVF